MGARGLAESHNVVFSGKWHSVMASKHRMEVDSVSLCFTFTKRQPLWWFSWSSVLCVIPMLCTS